MKKAIINASLFLAEGIVKNKVLMLENGIITAIEDASEPDAEIIDAEGSNLAAGLIDIQLNGGEELYFSDNISAATLDDMQQACLKEGTTHFLPCLISSPQQNILQAIEVVKNYAVENKSVLGLHLEGPFLNPEKRGAHNPDYVRKPTNNELAEIIKYGKGVIKIITIAPDQFTTEQLKMLQEAGIIISMGHTDLTYEQAQHYFNEGIHLVTHLFNAMSQFGHRSPGIVGAVLDNENVYAPIILDGAHTHYAAARIAYKIKKEKLFLITDSSFLGRKKLKFNSSFLNAELQDGFYRNEEGNLAGAAISLPDAIKNATTHLKVDLHEALQMANSRVAAAIGISQTHGKIAPGYPASFIKFEDNFSDYESWVFDQY